MKSNSWGRRIDAMVLIATSLGGGIVTASWILLAWLIPQFVQAARHPQYGDPNDYVWGYLLIVSVAGMLVGLVDALLFFVLRRVSDAMGAGARGQIVSAFLASVVIILAAYWFLLKSDPGTNPILFVGVMSAVSFAGFLVWILAARRAN